MLSLASYLDERSAHIKMAMAGTKPNYVHYILDKFFGFWEEDTDSEPAGNVDDDVPSTSKNKESKVLSGSIASALPAHLMPKAKEMSREIRESTRQSHTTRYLLTPSSLSQELKKKLGPGPDSPRNVCQLPTKGSINVPCARSILADLISILFRPTSEEIT